MAMSWFLIRIKNRRYRAGSSWDRRLIDSETVSTPFVSRRIKARKSGLLHGVGRLSGRLLYRMIFQLADRQDFNADHLSGIIEVQNYTGLNRLRFNHLAVAQLDVERICNGVKFDFHSLPFIVR